MSHQSDPADHDGADPGRAALDALAVTAIGCRVVVGLVGLDAGQRADLAASWAWCEPVLERRPRSECDAVAVLGGGAADDAAPVDADADADGPVLVVADTLDQLAETVTTVVTQLAIDQRRDDLLLLHAGGVADPVTGAVVAYVAPSGHGKTTASRALGHSLGYVTDETVAVGDDGVVVRYPKPLSVRGPAGPGASRPKAQVSPDAAGLRRAPDGPLTLARVVLLDRDPAATEVTVGPIGLAEAAARLFPQISYLGARTRPLRRLQALLEHTGGLLVVRYAEAATLEPAVRALLAAPTPAATPRGEGPGEATVALDAHLASSGAPSDVPGGGALVATAVDDWVADAGSVVVLHRDSLRTVSGIGVAVWHAARAGRTLDEAVAAVVREHGLPGAGPEAGARARELVRAAVDELAAAGLVRQH